MKTLEDYIRSPIVDGGDAGDWNAGVSCKASHTDSSAWRVSLCGGSRGDRWFHESYDILVLRGIAGGATLIVAKPREHVGLASAWALKRENGRWSHAWGNAHWSRTIPGKLLDEILAMDEVMAMDGFVSVKGYG